ncbi:hypothetical protein A9X04_13335 [Mycobacterium sp. E3247]|nr:hypothetical protein A9X04_13335 [Mycobacterium sp. E3247]
MRDVAQARAVGIHAVDLIDDRRRHGVRFEAVKSLPEICLGGVRVRAGIDELITIGGATTEVSGRVLRECRHRRTDAHLDSGALPLAHAAEKRHHQVVRLGAGIDRSTDLRDP